MAIFTSERRSDLVLPMVYGCCSLNMINQVRYPDMIVDDKMLWHK